MELPELNSESDIETIEESIDKMVWYKDQKTQVMNVLHTRGENDYTYSIDFRNGETLKLKNL